MEAFVGKLGLTLSSMHQTFPSRAWWGLPPVTGKTIAIPMSVATMIWVHFDGQLSVLEGKLSIS